MTGLNPWREKRKDCRTTWQSTTTTTCTGSRSGNEIRLRRSYYYLAFVNERDAGHHRAIEFSRSYRGHAVTTEWVLTEVADALSGPEQRAVFVELLSELQDDSGLTIVEATHRLFEVGVKLFAERADKSWSLTDCISFAVMQELGIRDALTADHHFEQAGYTPLLK